MFGFGKKKKVEPVYIENEFGKFMLVENHSTVKRDGKKVPFVYRYYDGDALWHGAESKISATVRCNDDPTGEAGFRRLAWAVENSAELERRLIDYTLDDFTDSENPTAPIEIWSNPDNEESDNETDEEPDPMPPEEFRKHISVNFICVEDDETISVDMSLDGLFTDHGFMIHIDKNGEITGGELWG